MKSNLIEKISGVLMFSFPPMLVAVPDGGAAVLVLLFLISVIGLLRNRIKCQLTSDEKLLLITVGIFFLILAANIWYFDVKIRELDNFTRFIVLLPVYFFIRKSELNCGYAFYGILAGAIASFGIAYYQISYLDVDRAYGAVKIISFGGISTTLGLMCLAIALLGKTWWFRLLFLAGFVLGCTGSLLSESRGPWIALLTGLLTLGVVNPMSWSVKLRIATGLLALLVLVSSYTIPIVKNRVDLTVTNINSYFSNNIVDSPVAFRLETWRGSIIAFTENPVLGIGEGNFSKKMKQLAAQGRVHPVVLRFNHTHNEFISAALYRGIPGLLSVLLLFVVPLIYFIKSVKSVKSVKSDVTMLSISGVMLIVCSMTVALSDIFFSQHVLTIFYAAYIYIFYGLLHSKSPNPV